MKIETIKNQGREVAVVESEAVLVTDVQSALDLMMTVRYETDCDAVAIEKKAVAEEFFDLKTRLAGEVLQKFVTYQMKVAIYGDFSGYESRALRDFIYECNQGNTVFFQESREAAVQKLSNA